MIPQTIGIRYDVGRIAPVQCVKNDTLKDIDIKDHCFLLLIVQKGTACFQVGNRFFEAVAPCFVCFDEREQPKLVKKRGLKCDAVYFHPSFLNVNMTFERVHSESYTHLSISHDLFLLRPFTDTERFAFHLYDQYKETIQSLLQNLDNELREQKDWYWSCRSRSYFMEIILILERVYGLFGQENSLSFVDSTNRIINPHLKSAVVYIESNYQDNITIRKICDAAQINHTNLTQLFKQELNVTPFEYLWNYRILVARKHLAFTTIPVKEVSERCGFKSIQHFARKFGELTGVSPTAFRKSAVAERKAAFR